VVCQAALDESAVIDALLEGVGGGSGGERLVELQGRSRGVLRVERLPPRRTPSGKILHVQRETDLTSGRAG
jgi:hypothetical protein